MRWSGSSGSSTIGVSAMNCDECKEQIFELIEREAVDPEGVREVLSRCPECRALFDEMKSALRSAAELPVEEPPAEVDAAVMRAARDRSRKVVPLRRRWFRSPQWAVAAAALLAIGIGVWSIPRGGEVVMEDAPVPAAELAESVESAPAIGEQAERPRSARAKRKAVADVEEVVAAEHEAAAPAAARQSYAAGAVSDSVAMDADANEAPQKKEQKGVSPECQARLSALERRSSEEDDASVDPEEALAIGRCYQAAGDVDEARRWLMRAASHPDTKARAIRALSELPAE